MNIPFQYRSISTDFISKLCEMALTGESTVLLGTRYGGKRYIMYRIRRFLSQAQAGPVVWIKFLNDPPVSTEQYAKDVIKESVRVAERSLEINESTDDLLGAIDQLYRHTGKRVILLAANVDGMAHHLARRFLQGVRKRVQDGQLVVVLSGEDDFRDLVYGPNSEFNCANKFVLQGFAEDEFNDYIDGYLTLLREDFKLSHEKRQEFWRRTGGSGYLARMVLRKLAEDHVRTANQDVTKFEVLGIPTSLKKAGISGAFGAHVFSHATDLISREPSCWDDLERLINDKAVRVQWEENPPSRLELAGVATRMGNRLVFASELMRSFVRDHYDNRRFGDLYVSIGQWDRAFDRYARLSVEEAMRPSGADDKAAVESTINSLCAALHSEAAKGIEPVQNLFVKGCRYLLGFRDITFWKSEAEWEPLPLKDFTPNRQALEEIASLLPQDRSRKPGLFQLGGALDKCSIASILPGLGQDERVAVVIGDFEKRTVISIERARLAKKVVGHFISAYSHAVKFEKIEQRLQVRNEHIEIINSIFDALGSEVINARQVILMAASRLRRLGYSRVLFCLVDPKQKRIQGVWDDSEDDNVNVAEMTNWALDPPNADLQPYVIFTKQPKIVPDAANEPLANLTVVDRAKMRSEAIVPILNADEEAIGTIHIERTDGSVPRQDEVDDLLLFGRQLAVVIEQSERVNMLQSALDKTPEPVLIIDSLEKTRYANRAAHDLVDVPVGWQSRSKAEPITGDGTQQIRAYLRKTLDDEHRRVHHLTGIGKLPNYRGAALFDKIQDWRDQTIGAVLHIEDLNYIYRIFEAFRFIAEANDTGSAMRSMLESMEKLGHKWGRLYVGDEQNTDGLISKLSYGPMLPEDQKDFEQGEVVLQLHSDPNQIDWKCIDDGNPLVFRWDPDCEDRESTLTEHGLRVINVRYAFWPRQIRKEPGDFWIDFPLVTEEKTLGKMSLQCDADFRPEDYEMLKVLSKGLLDAFLRREREFDRQKRLLQQTADRTLGVTAHSINSHIATISALLSEYRENERGESKLNELNDRFEANVKRVGDAIRRMTETLGPLYPKPERFDLVELMTRSLSYSLKKVKWELSPQEGPISVLWDYHMIDTVLTQLIDNSKAFIPEINMRINVRLENQRNGSVDWVKIVYGDNGPGIPPELKQRIFDEFFSQRPGKRRSTGIGLTFVQRVAREHGGAVREVGEFGRGAVFEILIPRDPFSGEDERGKECFAS